MSSITRLLSGYHSHPSCKITAWISSHMGIMKWEYKQPWKGSKADRDHSLTSFNLFWSKIKKKKKCGVWSIKSCTIIKTNLWRMYTLEVVKRAHHRGVEEIKSLLSQFRLIPRHSRVICFNSSIKPENPKVYLMWTYWLEKCYKRNI